MTARLKFLAAATGLWLAGCLGGTGTDTENGIAVTARMVGPSGAPMAHVEVSVNSMDAEPGTGAEAPLMPGSSQLTTDSAGYVQFVVKRKGSYMAQARRGDTVLILDTLKAVKGDTVVLQGGPVHRLRGKVRLYSGYRLDTGKVFLRGSTVSAAITRAGDYDFGYVPVSASKLPLGARYSSRPAVRVFVRLADAAGSPLVVDSRFSLDSSLKPGNTSNLTLLKASGSATEVCPDEAVASLEPGVSIRGSVNNPAEIKRAASFACSEKVGAQIQVDQSNLSGHVVKELGSYILPDPSAWSQEYRKQNGLGTKAKGLKPVVPVTCLKAGTNPNYNTGFESDSAKTWIAVDDIGLESACGF